MKRKFITICAIVFIFPTLVIADFNDLPPYSEPITIQYCDKLFGLLKGQEFFTTIEPDNILVGQYSYSFSISWPQLHHIFQAAIIGHRNKLYSAWWRSERRDTRIISSALLYCLERIELDTFDQPSPYRFNEAERKLRIEEMAFVTANLEYFYKQFVPLFEAKLGKNHTKVKLLKAKPNLKSEYLKYDPVKEMLIKTYKE